MRTTTKTLGALAPLFLASVLAAGCGGATGTEGSGAAAVTEEPDPTGWPVEAGTHDLSYVTPWDGRTRFVRLHLPTGFDANDGVARPLLMALHGGLGSGNSFDDSTGFSVKADADNVIVVFPTGTSMLESYVAGTGKLGTWNASTECCGQGNVNGVDDVRFLTDLVGRLTRAYRIHTGRIFAAGHSNGGVMSWRLACDAPQLFAGIGVNAADSTTLHPDGTPCNLGGRTVSVLNLHGDADPTMPYYGGDGGADNYVREPVEDPDPTLYDGQTDIGQWTALNGAPFVPVETETTDGYVRKTFCGTNGVPVINYKILGGEHAWYDESNSSISSTELMWDFFKRVMAGSGCP